MIEENPFHKKGGRPPKIEIIDRVFKIIQSRVNFFKKHGMPMTFFRPRDVLDLYEQQYKEAPDLKTMKKYLQILCDKGELRKKVMYDNNAKTTSKRRVRCCYEYNYEI